MPTTRMPVTPARRIIEWLNAHPTPRKRATTAAATPQDLAQWFDDLMEHRLIDPVPYAARASLVTLAKELGEAGFGAVDWETVHAHVRRD